MATGAFWMLSFKVLDKGIGAISTFILVRLLMPEDFGLVAMSMAFLGMLSILVGFSFDTALIQNQNARREHYDTVWTFHVMFGFFLATLLVLLANPVAIFYEEPRLETLLYAIALSCPIEWSGNIGTVAFRKELDFRKEFIFGAIKRLTVFFITLGLAYYLRSYWALVFGIIIGKTIGTLISYLIHPYRPGFCLSARHDLMNFSKWTFMNSIVGFIKTKASDFVIGKVVGTQSLGIFTVANEIAGLISSEVIAPINRVALPGYSKLNQDTEKLRDTFLKVQSVIVICATPAALGIIAVADLFVQCLLGEKWLAAIPIIQIMAFQGFGESLASNSGVILISLGKPKLLTMVFTTYSVILLIGLLLLVNQYGLIGAAYASVMATAFSAPTSLALALFQLKLKISHFVASSWRPVFSSIAMYGFVSTLSIKIDLFVSLTIAEKLIVCVLSGMLFYAVLLLLLWRVSKKPNSGETIILNIVFSKLKKRVN